MSIEVTQSFVFLAAFGLYVILRLGEWTKPAALAASLFAAAGASLLLVLPSLMGGHGHASMANIGVGMVFMFLWAILLFIGVAAALTALTQHFARRKARPGHRRDLLAELQNGGPENGSQGTPPPARSENRPSLADESMSPSSGTTVRAERTRNDDGNMSLSSEE